jgi:hypothetical protein
LIGFGDIAQEDGTDDTSAAPHERNSRIIQFPAIIMGSGPHEHKPLGIRDEFGGIERLLQFIDKGLFVALETDVGGTLEGLGGADAFVADGGEAACKNGFADEGYWLAEVEGVDCGPFSGALPKSDSEVKGGRIGRGGHWGVWGLGTF